MNLNRVQLAGRLTRDPNLKATPKGTAVCDLGLAINRTWVVDGQKNEETIFVDVTFWGKKAEVIAQYFQKGKPIYIEGRLKLDSWEDRETGKKRTKLGITGEEFQFLGDGGGSGQQSRPQQSQQRQPAPAQSSLGIDDEDDDVPF